MVQERDKVDHRIAAVVVAAAVARRPVGEAAAEGVVGVEDGRRPGERSLDGSWKWTEV